MERGDALCVSARPTHPYTEALLAAAPVSDPVLQAARRKGRISLHAQDTDDTWVRVGCPFAPRCALVSNRCRTERPLLTLVSVRDHVACHERSGTRSELSNADDVGDRSEQFCVRGEVGCENKWDAAKGWANVPQQ